MRRFIPFLPRPPLVPVIRLSGTIGVSPRALSDAALAPLIDKAFRLRPAAVALVINSPGGSPAQSSLIAARLRRLADEKGVPLHAFVEDVAASGGYWLACAADRIWLDANSIVGSIGVISASFGFHDLLARQGVERRVITAGRSKSLADPFLPQTDEDVARIRAIQTPIHEGFIAHVKARRGARLAEGEDLFNAEIWVGERAVRLGLADGLAHLHPKMVELFGPKVHLLPMAPRRGLLARLGFGIVEDMILAVEERAARARLGL